MRRLIAALSIVVICLTQFVMPTLATKITASTIINITPEGFEPREIKVKKGDFIKFINEDTADRWPASNLHPTHILYPEFDPQQPLKSGYSWSFKAEKVGTWKYHDHLFAHVRGVLIVESEKKLTSQFFAFLESLKYSILQIFPFSQVSESEAVETINSDFVNLPEKQQHKFLSKLTEEKGAVAAWQLLVKTYSGNPQAHDLAHFIGHLIYKAQGAEGMGICDASFAFGCFHGLTEEALTTSLDQLQPLAKGCETAGKVGSGPWASCIHGTGHGVATYFETTNLLGALKACDVLTQGANYCHDGVFMEFSINAPKSFYLPLHQNNLYPCDSLNPQYHQACARSLPVTLAKYVNKTWTQISQTCSSAKSEDIRYHCINSLGLQIGQISGGKAETIIKECNKIFDIKNQAECKAAAAGELIFQNVLGWQETTERVCATLYELYKEECKRRILQIRKTYNR